MNELPELRDIAVCSIAYTHYASDPRVRRMCEALVQAGARVDVISLRAPGAAPQETLHGVRVHGLDLSRHRGAQSAYWLAYLRFFAAAARRLAALHAQAPFALVHVNTMPDFLAFAALPARWRGVPVILDIHDAMPELFEEKFPSGARAIVAGLRLAERWSARAATHVLAVQEPHRARLVQNRIPPEKITTILNAPDPAIFRPLARTPDPRHFRLAYHGTVAHRHGLDLAIRALELARRTRPRLALRIIGDGDAMDAVQRLTQELGVDDAVEFRRGLVPVTDVPRQLEDVDAGVVPQRAGPAMSISLPTKLLEYAALGIPSIASRTLATAHYFPPDAVLYFEPGDVEGLASQMVALHDDGELRRRLASAASEVVHTFAWDGQRQRYLQLVARLTGRAGA